MTQAATSEKTNPEPVKTPEAAFAKTRDNDIRARDAADVKSRDADIRREARRAAEEKRKAERRQHWVERRRPRQDQELREVEERVREETEPRQVFAAEPVTLERPGSDCSIWTDRSAPDDPDRFTYPPRDSTTLRQESESFDLFSRRQAFICGGLPICSAQNFPASERQAICSSRLGPDCAEASVAGGEQEDQRDERGCGSEREFCNDFSWITLVEH